MAKRVLRYVALPIGLVFAMGIMYIGLVLMSLHYLDDQIVGIHPGETRGQVQDHLRCFRESKVGVSDIPVGFRDWIVMRPGYTVCRYDLVCKALSLHVVYDARQRVVGAIPTYE